MLVLLKLENKRDNSIIEKFILPISLLPISERAAPAEAWHRPSTFDFPRAPVSRRTASSYSTD